MLKNWKHFDFTLMIAPILLAGFGVVMVYSASMVVAVVDGFNSNYYLIRQSIFFIIALIGFAVISFLPYQLYQRLMKIIIISCIVLLVAVLFFGDTVNNARSWFRFGPFSLQPAEVAKLGLIIYLSAIYSKKQAYLDQFSKGVLPPLIITAVVLGLIVGQPDIGTASIIFLMACSVIFASGIKWRHLFLLVFTGLILLAFAIPNMVTEERLSRFTGAYQPFNSPDLNGYQLIQSYVAIGNGGLTGEGLGQSIQKLGFLVEGHTDFIMAIIAEELGFVGVAIVLGLLAAIVFRGLYISRQCQDSFGSLLALGIASMVGIQTFINLGAISGVLPITGVPLPFISYGGSSLLFMMIAMGILNNIAMQVNKKEIEKEELAPKPGLFQRKSINSYRGGKA
ncbi:putative lipid II flippase FtsW [Oceanobacillus neutriphilus]|uniref:Probable peptidoglycan glycosyltransferase FtsW n=1 Tax=Oceanobacillus neutriphilus TaxID=531815 RepID=A0ABQ2P1E9_9BACI|nr:putative lipid II flippase FtsW [Oceanobacillus neutriphilus]GGP15806.1 putative lipid II flippase FtsW [Oceanobacillus neutriphilus]